MHQSSFGVRKYPILHTTQHLHLLVPNVSLFYCFVPANNTVVTTVMSVRADQSNWQLVVDLVLTYAHPCCRHFAVDIMDSNALAVTEGHEKHDSSEKMVAAQTIHNDKHQGPSNTACPEIMKKKKKTRKKPSGTATIVAYGTPEQLLRYPRTKKPPPSTKLCCCPSRHNKKP